MSAAMELHVALSLRLDATEAYRLAHAYRDEELAKGAHLIEDAACDADWERPADYCQGLRAGAELLLANTGEKATTTTADFFQPGHTYTREHHDTTIRFRVRYTDSSPCGTYRAAHGWRIEDGDVTWSPFNSDDFTGWTYVTEEASR
jgi:hypothetical protein